MATVVLGVEVTRKLFYEYVRALTSAYREVLESLRTMVDIQVRLLSVIPAKECKGLESRIFLLGDTRLCYFYAP